MATDMDKESINFDTSKGGRFWGILDVLGKLVTASILWGICSLPVFTAGAATAALYYTVCKAVRRDLGTVWGEFFRAFRADFWQAARLTLIFLGYMSAVSVLFLLLRRVWPGQEGLAAPGLYICFALLVPAALMFLTACPILSRFYFDNGQVLRLSLYICAKHLWAPALALLALALFSALSLALPAVLIFTPGICCYLCSFAYEPVLKRFSETPSNDI